MVWFGPAPPHCVSVVGAWLQLQLGVEFEASTRMQETSASFGYQLDVPKANLLFKGTPSNIVYYYNL